ncbi:hypothetical protein DITRI_Ditri09bG0122100 [Diplodiscus trichospermus]
MNERLWRAAQSGNVNDLYPVIKDDADVFRRIDQMEFVDTPLHIAAAAGHTEFAMEMINLKPSLARKLNQEGFSPIHLALQNQYHGLVVNLLWFDNNIVRVKGRKGYTPLHYVASKGNVDLLSQFLDHCPNCILDLTGQKETALHIAAKENQLQAFKDILEWIQRTPENDQFQRRRILNLQDNDGNTALHIAASNNQTQMIELLTKCEEVDRSKVNLILLTALEVLQQRQSPVEVMASVKILTRAPSRLSKLSETKLKNYIKDMKLETINALLVVFTLVLTMTYQAIFNPPGGFSQGDSTNTSNHEGKSVLTPSSFLWFYIPNGVTFTIAWVITLELLEVVAKSITSFLFPLYFLMCSCYGLAVGNMAPIGASSTYLFVFGPILCFIVYCICLYRFRK